jgi:hypothetical protein
MQHRINLELFYYRWFATLVCATTVCVTTQHYFPHTYDSMQLLQALFVTFLSFTVKKSSLPSVGLNLTDRRRTKPS